MKSLLNEVNPNNAQVSQINMADLQSGFEGAIQKNSKKYMNILILSRALSLEVGGLDGDL